AGFVCWTPIRDSCSRYGQGPTTVARDIVMYADAPRIPTLALLLAAASLLLGTAQSSCAQTTVSTGSIVGLVSDPSGAVIAGAQIAITNTATRQLIEVTTNSAGSFLSGALIPGRYRVIVSTKGFCSLKAEVTVLVGNTATLNLKMQLGQGSEVVEVQGSETI